MSDTKTEYARWIHDLEEAFAGPTGIVGERVFKIQENEQQLAGTAPIIHHGFYVRLMDSFMDWVLHSLSSMRKPPELYDMALLCPCFWTIRSSYNIFWHGYYCNGVALLRSVFETIFLLSAEQSGAIKRFKLCSILEKGSRAGKSERQKVMEHDFRKLLGQIERHLYGRNSGLSAPDTVTLTRFFDFIHAHVHLSFFAFYSLFMEGKRSKRLDFLPHIDENQVGRYLHYSEAAAWLFLRTVRRLQTDMADDAMLGPRFQLLDAAFRFATEAWPVETAQAWLRFIDAKFPILGKQGAP